MYLLLNPGEKAAKYMNNPQVIVSRLILAHPPRACLTSNTVDKDDPSLVQLHYSVFVVSQNFGDKRVKYIITCTYMTMQYNYARLQNKNYRQL